ncbi:hypothetical protein [Actinoplanes auranticolor]|uniref:ATP/GTP-binding protein n=1 Tax=Actinoplanes auranticolor TaxID=47988 RepID=A0A919ST28_9ACTN|nr:hypothetical protein [Actinoplanes auranticolor]GIM76952.1 ATP/GTP-binding protein [Actinoplanes auranticolor]
MDLERLFAVSSGAAITSHAVFTNRVAELAAFRSAVQRVAALRRSSGRLTEDLGRGRDNVLAFYGMGGIGKSTLSRELQRRFDEGEVPVAERRVSARVDFADLSTFDPEVMLLRLRGCLGGLTGELHAFDLAFAAYWERKHPGQPLAEFLDRRSAIGALEDKAKLSDTIQSGLDAFLGGTGLVGAAWRLGTLVKDGVAARLAKAAVLRDCPFFEPLMTETQPDRARQFLPALLAWDLEQFQRRDDADVTIFLDTWETVQAQRREPGGVEDALSRLVYLMPNVLFVVTGRSQLSWADPERAVDLKYAGPQCWPGLDLRGGAPDQRLLGALSPEDCERYLRQRLVVEGGPAIPGPIRERIIAGSQGLPLYLDLSAEHFDSLSGRGTPQAEDFGSSLPHLVTRVIRDLDGGERQLLRAAALVTGFNRDLLHAAVPEHRDAVIHRFTARHFVREERVGWLRHSMHDTLRASVREYDSVSGDPWSAREWREAAGRIVEFFRREIAEDVAGGTTAYRSRLVEAFLDAAQLALEFSLPADWLLDVAKTVCALGQWQVLQRLESLPQAPGSAGNPVVLGCRAAYRRDVAGLGEALELLDLALAEPAPTPDTTLWLELERAEVLMRLDRNAEAQTILERLARRSDRFGRRARHWRAILDERAGRFPAVLGWAAGEDGDTPDDRRAVASMTGFVRLANAEFERAAEQFAAAVEAAREGRLPPAEALMREHLAWATAWCDPAAARGLASEALELNRRIGSLIGTARSLAACALAGVGSEQPADVLAQTRESLRLIERTGYRADALHPLLVELLLHCVTGDAAAAATVRERILTLIADNETHVHLRDVTGWWTGEPGPATTVAWLDGEENARRRWSAVLVERRDAYARRDRRAPSGQGRAILR